MRSFNAAPPTDLEGAVEFEFEIGWEHEVVDGVLVLTRDEAGQPIPRRYSVSRRVTAQAVLDAVKEVGADRIADMTSGGIDAVVELVGAVAGRATLLAIASDPTVSSDAFLELVSILAEELGLGDAVPDPTTAPTGASSAS
jgi:hypothetical protein